jgi:hypothetical protein
MEKSHTMATRERTVRGRRFSDRFIAGVLRVFSRVHLPSTVGRGGSLVNASLGIACYSSPQPGARRGNRGRSL